MKKNEQNNIEEEKNSLYFNEEIKRKRKVPLYSIINHINNCIDLIKKK